MTRILVLTDAERDAVKVAVANRAATLIQMTEEGALYPAAVAVLDDVLVRLTADDHDDEDLESFIHGCRSFTLRIFVSIKELPGAGQPRVFNCI